MNCLAPPSSEECIRDNRQRFGVSSHMGLYFHYFLYLQKKPPKKEIIIIIGRITQDTIIPE
jgi:hypothetical protein